MPLTESAAHGKTTAERDALAEENDRLRRRLSECEAALSGTSAVPISVLTWHPGGARGNWPTFAPHEPILIARSIGGKWFFDEISTRMTDARDWPEWPSVTWYAHLSGVTLPGPCETEDDAE